MIRKTNLMQLRNGEIIQFFSNLIDILQSRELPPLAAVISAIQQAYTNLTNAYRIERGSKVTGTLIELDAHRDMYFVALRTILEQHAKAHPDEKMRPNAAALFEIVTRHGTMLHRKSYQEQSAGMNDIGSIITNDETLISHLEGLSLTNYFVAMKDANTNFNDKYLERNREYSQLSDASMEELRDQAEEQFAQLARHIEAHLVLAEDKTPYQELKAEINTLLDAYYEVVERRSAGGGNDDPETNADYEEDNLSET